MSSVNKGSSTSFSVWMTVLSFSCLTALATVFSTTRYSESGHLYHFTDHRLKSIQLSTII